MGQKIAIIIILIILYSILFSYTYTFIIPKPKYSVKLIYLKNIIYENINIISYNPQSDSFLLRINTKKGDKIAFINGKEGYIYDLGPSTILDSCASESYGALLIYNKNIFKLLEFSSNPRSITLKAPGSIPEDTYLLCNKNNIFIVYGFLNKTHIINLSLNELPRSVETIVDGTPTQAKLINNKIFIIINNKQIDIIKNKPSITQYRVESCKSWKVVGDGIITCKKINKNIIRDIYYNKSIVLTYEKGAGSVEAVIRKNGYLILTRPPGDWMHLVYMGEKWNSEIEIFYMLSYMYESAYTLNEKISVTGILYNNSNQIVSLLNIKGAVKGHVNIGNTILLAINPDKKAKIHYYSNNKTSSNTVKLIWNPVNITKKTIKIIKINILIRSESQYYDYIERFITSVIIDIVIAYAMYTSLLGKKQ